MQLTGHTVLRSDDNISRNITPSFRDFSTVVAAPHYLKGKHLLSELLVGSEHHLSMEHHRCCTGVVVLPLLGLTTSLRERERCSSQRTDLLSQCFLFCNERHRFYMITSHSSCQYLRNPILECSLIIYMSIYYTQTHTIILQSLWGLSKHNHRHSQPRTLNWTEFTPKTTS